MSNQPDQPKLSVPPEVIAVLKVWMQTQRSLGVHECYEVAAYYEPIDTFINQYNAAMDNSSKPDPGTIVWTKDWRV